MWGGGGRNAAVERGLLLILTCPMTGRAMPAVKSYQFTGVGGKEKAVDAC